MPWPDAKLPRFFQAAYAAANTRRVCSGLKAMPSQKASTASAKPSAASDGSISPQTRSM